MTTGERIRSLRLRANVRVVDLAAVLHCTRGTIRNYETGGTHASPQVIEKIASHLGVSVSDVAGPRPTMVETLLAKKSRVKRGDAVGTIQILGEPFHSRISSLQRQIFVVARCCCGTVFVTEVYGMFVKRWPQKTCGCQANAKHRIHGGARTRLYAIYKDMRLRCTSPKRKRYKHYGGRGITVCQEWSRFENFREWALANGYASDLTLDRRDNDGNYCPENCRWTTRSVQDNNKQNSVRITAFGERKTVAEWSRDTRCVVSYQVLGDRMRKWSDKSGEEMLTTPSRPRMRRCQPSNVLN